MESTRRRTVSKACETAAFSRFVEGSLRHLEMDDSLVFGLLPVLGLDPLQHPKCDPHDVVGGGGHVLGAFKPKLKPVDPMAQGCDPHILLFAKTSFELGGNLIEFALQRLVHRNRVFQMQSTLEIQSKFESSIELARDPSRSVAPGDSRNRRNHHQGGDGEQRQQQQRFEFEEPAHGVSSRLAVLAGLFQHRRF